MKNSNPRTFDVIQPKDRRCVAYRNRGEIVCLVCKRKFIAGGLTSFMVTMKASLPDEHNFKKHQVGCAWVCSNECVNMFMLQRM